MKIFKFFSVSLNTLSGSSHLQIFFKIGAIKNFATLRIKKRLERRCFPVRSSHVDVNILIHFLPKMLGKRFLCHSSVFIFKEK